METIFDINVLQTLPADNAIIQNLKTITYVFDKKINVSSTNLLIKLINTTTETTYTFNADDSSKFSYNVSDDNSLILTFIYDFNDGIYTAQLSTDSIYYYDSNGDIHHIFSEISPGVSSDFYNFSFSIVEDSLKNASTVLSKSSVGMRQYSVDDGSVTVSSEIIHIDLNSNPLSENEIYHLDFSNFILKDSTNQIILLDNVFKYIFAIDLSSNLIFEKIETNGIVSLSISNAASISGQVNFIPLEKIETNGIVSLSISNAASISGQVNFLPLEKIQFDGILDIPIPGSTIAEGIINIVPGIYYSNVIEFDVNSPIVYIEGNTITLNLNGMKLSSNTTYQLLFDSGVILDEDDNPLSSEDFSPFTFTTK